MGMIMVIIVMAAAMLYLGFIGRERGKEQKEEAMVSLFLPPVIAVIAGFACMFLIASVGGDLWGILIGSAVYFGILFYFLVDGINRAHRASQQRIAQLESKIVQLTELLKEKEKNDYD